MTEVHKAGSVLDRTVERMVRERAHALWEADGQPEGRELEYWLKAEQEVFNLSDAGEEDPLSSLDFVVPGADDRRRDG